MQRRISMSGPSEGKHKIKVNAYIHEKGKSLARITHIDIEGDDISKTKKTKSFQGDQKSISISDIIKPGEITFVKGKEGGCFIALKKDMIERAERIIKKR